MRTRIAALVLLANLLLLALIGWELGRSWPRWTAPVTADTPR